MCSLHHTICQILTGKVPLGHVPYVDFIELVVNLKVRPNRPPDDRSGILDDIWPLAEECWSEDPRRRPTAGQVCDAMKLVLEHSKKKVASPTIRRPSLPPSPQSPRATSPGGRSNPSSSISGRRDQATSSSSAGRGPSLITTPPQPPSHQRGSPPVHLPPLRLPPFERKPSSHASPNHSLWSPQSQRTRPAERTSSEARSPIPPTLGSDGSHSRPSTGDMPATPSTPWSDIFSTTPVLDFQLSSTHIGGNTSDLDTDEIKSPGTTTRRPGFMKRFFGGRTTTINVPDFRINDRYHPIPKCRNTSVEKWTLDDMLDRYIRSSGQFFFYSLSPGLDVCILSADTDTDKQFRFVFLSTYPVFSDDMRVYQGFHDRFNIPESELGHPQLWVERRLEWVTLVNDTAEGGY